MHAERARTQALLGTYPHPPPPAPVVSVFPFSAPPCAARARRAASKTGAGRGASCPDDNFETPRKEKTKGRRKQAMIADGTKACLSLLCLSRNTPRERRPSPPPFPAFVHPPPPHWVGRSVFSPCFFSLSSVSSVSPFSPFPPLESSRGPFGSPPLAANDPFYSSQPSRSPSSPAPTTHTHAARRSPARLLYGSPIQVGASAAAPSFARQTKRTGHNPPAAPAARVFFLLVRKSRPRVPPSSSPPRRLSPASFFIYPSRLPMLRRFAPPPLLDRNTPRPRRFVFLLTGAGVSPLLRRPVLPSPPQPRPTSRRHFSLLIRAPSPPQPVRTAGVFLILSSLVYLSPGFSRPPFSFLWQRPPCPVSLCFGL